MINLLAAESGLAGLVCDSADCLSYILVLLDIFTILYLSYCAAFKMNKGVRIFGWVWTAVVVTATVVIVALHTCIFTLLCALFSTLVLMAVIGVTLEDIGNKNKTDEKVEEKVQQPAIQMICPYGSLNCPAFAGQAPAKVEAKEETATVEEVAATVDEDSKEMTLKESLALANEVGVKVDVTKQYIIDYLTERYSNEVVCNGRINYTKTGLPLADTHYAVSNGEKSKCFVYVYETDVATMLLVRLSDEAAALLKKKGIALRKSAFPKSREEGFTWYSLIPDDNCPASDVQEVLNTAYALAK